MKITVLGATGKTGIEVVRQALAGGHDVTALVRRPDGLPIRDDRLRVVVGDARDPGVIADITEGQDAVVSSLGIPASGRTRAEISDDEKVDVCLVSTQHLFEQAKAERIVLFSTHGAGSSNDGSPYVVALRELVGHRVSDKDDMEAYILASKADVRWTVIRNPYIYDGPHRDYDVYETITLDDTSRITYGDLAAFTLSEITEPRFAGKILTITEPQTGAEADTTVTPAAPSTPWAEKPTPAA